MSRNLKERSDQALRASTQKTKSSNVINSLLINFIKLTIFLVFLVIFIISLDILKSYWDLWIQNKNSNSRIRNISEID